MSDIGINFRATSGYVTDGANETYDLGEAYPITRGGVTFGFSSNQTGSARDRNAGIDRRLAGTHEIFNLGATWQLDLPASGDYEIHCAFGDESFAETNNGGELFDNTTSLALIGPTNTSAAHWLDATGTDRTTATWVSSEASITKTFATTTFVLKGPAASSDSWTSHLRFVQTTVASPPTITTNRKVRPRPYAPGLAR